MMGDGVGFGRPSLARRACSGLFYYRPLDAVIHVLVNNTGFSIRPLDAAVRQALRAGTGCEKSATTG